jgi:methylated-DNA-[protein]-cysteine S-methyltransferase
MYYSTYRESPVGSITLAGNKTGLVGLWIEGQKYFGGTVEGDVSQKNDLPVLAAAKKWLDVYFAGKNPSTADLPLAPVGGEFRRIVWELLCEIPYGGYTTYGEIAKKTAARMNKKTMSAQAVGGAVGHNPISIVIPCHRVVGSDGSLTGYAGGLDKKITLLELEGVDIADFFIPRKRKVRVAGM